MRYERFRDNVKLSKLGLGAMRLPQTEPGFEDLPAPSTNQKPGK
mgnify:CR=1